MSKIHTISMIAIAAVMSFGTAMAAPATRSHVDYRGAAISQRHIVQAGLKAHADYRGAEIGKQHIVQAALKATDDQNGPSWSTPAYTQDQVAATARNGESTLSAIDPEANPVAAVSRSEELATVPNNGETDLNAYDNAA